MNPLTQKLTKTTSRSGRGEVSIFEVQTANEAINQAKAMERPCYLLDTLFIEGEFTVLFGSSNCGKSLFAYQMADAISRGKQMEWAVYNALSEHVGTVALQMDIDEGKRVLYFDFELTKKQFEGRYSVDYGTHYGNHYIFDNRLYRVNIGPDMMEKAMPEIKKRGGFTVFVLEDLERKIREYQPHTIVIDNLTHVCNNMEKGKTAAELVGALRGMGHKYKANMLVLAHTPKRDMSKPMELTDLAGSAQFGNFIDAAFCIGTSTKDNSLRYVKQVKVRSAANKYGSDNVLLFQICKDLNYLGMKYAGTGKESEYLMSKQEADKAKKEGVDEALLENPNRSDRSLAKELGVSHTHVAKRRKALKLSEVPDVGDDE